jgi:nicotinate-nucleotide adenylyltransferase
MLWQKQKKQQGNFSMAGKKIGLFFGSFNPVHNGHLMIANYMAEFSDLDQVWFVISPLNPFKAGQDLLPDYHRRELLNRAIGDYPKFRISSVEFQLPKPSYTIDTLTFLASKYPDYQFTLIMGSDQLPEFHRWKNSGEILANYRIFVYPRPGGNRNAKRVTRDTEEDINNESGFPLHASRVSRYELENHPSITLVKAPMMEISSSFIRQSIKERKDVRFFMPELTWHYLDEMHFYSLPS